MGTQKKHLNETGLLSTQNTFLNWWIRKYSQFSVKIFVNHHHHHHHVLNWQHFLSSKRLKGVAGPGFQLLIQRCQTLRNIRTLYMIFWEICNVVNMLQDKLQYRLVRYPPPPFKRHSWGLITASSIIFPGLYLASVMAKNFYNLIVCISQLFLPLKSILIVWRMGFQDLNLFTRYSNVFPINHAQTSQNLILLPLIRDSYQCMYNFPHISVQVRATPIVLSGTILKSFFTRIFISEIVMWKLALKFDTIPHKIVMAGISADNEPVFPNNKEK